MNSSIFPTCLYKPSKTFVTNPLNINKSFTLKQYNNWFSKSPQFTWSDYINYYL